MNIEAPIGWQSLSDCFRCKYFLTCYEPVRRMCKTAETKLMEEMRANYHGPIIDDNNGDWGDQNEANS